MNPIQMSPQVQNDFIQSLLQGKTKPASELEAATLGQLRGISNDVMQKKLRHDALADEVATLKNDIKRLNGQREAYITILVMGESARRMPKAPVRSVPRPVPEASDSDTDKPMTLGELKKEMGADKIEAVDTEGNVVESTEDADEFLLAAEEESDVAESGE